ncbi:MAG: hypothetical protein V4720_06415 [Pseudomonadota bacterium]
MSLTDGDILGAMFRHVTLGQSMAQVGLTLGCSRSAVAGIIKRMRDAAPQVEAARLTDSQVKTILDRHFFGHTSAEVIAKDFAKRIPSGFNRQAVLYLIWWVMNDLHAAGPDQVMNPANSEVIDWPHWWRRAQANEVAA